jgi:hypothetical protein
MIAGLAASIRNEVGNGVLFIQSLWHHRGLARTCTNGAQHKDR